MTVGLMKADTDVILNVAQKIIKQNNQMQEEFNKLKNQVSKVHSSWNGPASDKVKSQFDKAARNTINVSHLFENYSNLLTRTISEGFVDVEIGNTSLADAFK